MLQEAPLDLSVRRIFTESAGSDDVFDSQASEASSTEYTTRGHHQVRTQRSQQRFACNSDFHDLNEMIIKV